MSKLQGTIVRTTKNEFERKHDFSNVAEDTRRIVEEATRKDPKEWAEPVEPAIKNASPEEEIDINEAIRRVQNAAPPIARKKEARNVPPPAEEHTPDLDNSFNRIDLPSQFHFYDWKDLHTRAITVPDQVKIARAVRHQNLTVLLDALSAMCNRDAREMCRPDFEALCYWHKFNSYLDSPMTITWNTRYGNRSTTTQKTFLREVRKFPDADVNEFLNEGITAPTMRDLELLWQVKDQPELDEDFLYLLSRAQYLVVDEELAAHYAANGSKMPTMEARIDQLKASELSVFDRIDKFAETFSNFGIDEFTRVIDPDYDYKKFAEVDPDILSDDAREEQDQVKAFIAAKCA